MRNWHHKVIKMEQARSLLPPANNIGSPNVYVGVIEGEIEFEAINAANPLTVNNYRPAHPSFSDINGTRKVFYRRKDTTNFTQEISTLDPSMHTTCVTGIIAAGVDNVNLINGISPGVRVINADNFENGLFLALINSSTNGNIRSSVNQAVFDVNFLNNGPSDATDAYSNNAVGIISCSFNISMDAKKVDFILKELFAYGRNGRGTLVIVSAGNGDSTTGNGLEINDSQGSAGYRATVFSNKTLIVGASKVLLDAFPLPSYSVPNPVFRELLADYSNYGKRVDLCAPSGPDAYPSKEDISIYSPTMLNCGNVGTSEQILSATILEVTSNWISSGKLILQNVKGLFKGQSMEIGDPNSYFHELRYITKVTEIANTNNVEVTLDAKFKYTKSFNDGTVNYNMVGSQARMVVLKKAITRYTDPSNNLVSNNKFTLNNLRGINPTLSKPQKVYIYPQNSPLLGIYTEIKSILNENTKLVEIQGSLTNLPAYLPANDPLILIPDQMKASLVCTNKATIFVANSKDDIAGFFVGQEVLVSGGGQDRISFITQKVNKSIVMSHCPGVIGDTYTITSLAYGDFTSRFTGTSAATPVVSGLAALLLSTNGNLNATEIKHILKVSAHQIGNVNYNDAPTDITKYNYGYTINKKYGTGRVDAQAAVQLALDWHTNPSVQKPKLMVADIDNSGVLDGVPVTDPVNSPDIWIRNLSDPNTAPPAAGQLTNTFDTSNDQKIYIRIRNLGNRNSFKETDVRVFVAFTDDVNPAFPFPGKWFDQTDVKLLAVKEVPIIAPTSNTVVAVEWKNIRTFWDTNNPLPSGGRRKRAYILAHVSPFDGMPTELDLTNLRGNKQLTCKEIIATHNGVSDGTAFFPGNQLDLTVGAQVASRSFFLSVDNLLNSGLANFKIQITKKNNDNTVETVEYLKTGNQWGFLNQPSSDWIAFGSTEETIVNYNTDYLDLKFPHTIKINQDEQEVKLEIINA